MIAPSAGQASCGAPGNAGSPGHGRSAKLGTASPHGSGAEEERRLTGLECDQPFHAADHSRGRTRLLLTATLFCDGQACPAQISEISAAGALLDAAVPPVDGALVQLVRADLIVHGLVVWREQRCEVKFSGSIDVLRWCAAPFNAEQQRIDDMVRIVKAGAVPLPLPAANQRRDDGDHDPSRDLREDLGRAMDLLEKLGTELASNPSVVGQHGAALQNLDIAMQIMAAAAASRCSAPARARLRGLRRSARQALRGGMA